MLKKMGYTLILALLLVGCSNEHKEPNEQIATITTADGIEIRLIENFEDLNLESPYHIFADSMSTIYLSNRITGEIKTVFEVESYQNIFNLQALDNYYVITVWSGDEVDIAVAGSVSEPFAVEFLVFNKDLNIIDSYRLTQEDDEPIFSMLPWDTQLAKQDGEWFIYFWRSNWSFDFTELLVYNLNTQDLSSIVEIDGSNFVITSNMIPSTNQLAFTSTYFDGESVSYVEVGWIDLDTFEINIAYSTDVFNSPMSDVFGEYLVVFDNWIEGDKLESEAVILHLLTGEVRKIPLEGYQTVWPTLTVDGEIMFTSLTDWTDPNQSTRVRLYNIQTTDVVFEYMLIDEETLSENEALFSLEFFNIDEHIYMIKADIGEVNEMGHSVGSIRSEYLIIEILVIDNE